MINSYLNFFFVTDVFEDYEIKKKRFEKELLSDNFSLQFYSFWKNVVISLFLWRCILTSSSTKKRRFKGARCHIRFEQNLP